LFHQFNELGMRSLDPRWAGGRPRRISAEDEAFLVATATTRPGRLGQPFTHWSVRKLVGYLADNPRRIVRIGRERARRLLAAHEVTFQRTKTWKESPDPAREAKLARIEEVLEQHPDRTFAFDEFGPLTIQPVPGLGGRRKANRSLHALGHAPASTHRQGLCQGTSSTHVEAGRSPPSGEHQQLVRLDGQPELGTDVRRVNVPAE
jgi:transposase